MNVDVKPTGQKFCFKKVRYVRVSDRWTGESADRTDVNDYTAINSSRCVVKVHRGGCARQPAPLNIPGQQIRIIVKGDGRKSSSR